jgi:hypothetical protein
LWFTWSINNLWLDNRQNINMDFKTWTWIITSNSWIILKIYAWIKFQESKVIDTQETYEYFFWKNDNYKILSTLSWAVWNNIFINYYSLDNLELNNENKLELIWIYKNINKTWWNYNSVEIKNLNWKKYIIPDWWSDIDKIYLFFEREWVEKFLEIKK